MYVRVTLDIKISYEEANFIRETFIDKYKLRELQLIPEQINQAQETTAFNQVSIFVPLFYKFY